MKKLLICLFLLIALIPTITAQDFAPREPLYAQLTYYRTSANLRAQPRTDGKIIGQVEHGMRLVILQKEVRDFANYRWTQVKIEGTDQVGWVFSEYINFCYESTLRTVTGELNVRASYGTNHPLVGTLADGEQVEVLAYENLYLNDGRWAYIRSQSSGLTGWVMTYPAYSLEGRESACNTPSISASPDTPLDVVVWGTQPLVVLEEQDANAALLVELPNGSRLQVIKEVIQHGGNWYQVQVNGLTGWVYSGWSLVLMPLRVHALPATLNIRSAPGESSPIINTLSANTCVTVTETSSVDGVGWFYASDIGGWLSSDYLARCFE